MAEKILSQMKAGVVYGKDLLNIFRIAKAEKFALPAVNVVGTDSVNAVLEAAKMANSPVMIQFSNGGSAFYAGKALSNDNEQAAIIGAISGAMHIHQVAESAVKKVNFISRDNCHNSSNCTLYSNRRL